MMTTAPAVIRETFSQSHAADDAFIRDGMSPIELRKLHELVTVERPASVLEIGMANGTSSVVIVDALRKASGGSLTSIDPNQTAPTPHGYDSAGLLAVNRLTDVHSLVEAYDFLALPKLLDAGKVFDFVLVDGFHSFDLTLLDLFYADKLLLPGGLLVCHDSSSPAVYKALRWLEENKPYQRLSPPLYTADLPIHHKIWNRLFQQTERQERQTNWQMLVAYRKETDHYMPEHHLSDF